ncbi:hypothetical protein H072_6753, partial [Dactylellina haptotyla CBS 200.50]
MDEQHFSVPLEESTALAKNVNQIVNDLNGMLKADARKSISTVGNSIDTLYKLFTEIQLWTSAQRWNQSHLVDLNPLIVRSSHSIQNAEKLLIDLKKTAAKKGIKRLLSGSKSKEIIRKLESLNPEFQDTVHALASSYYTKAGEPGLIPDIRKIPDSVPDAKSKNHDNSGKREVRAPVPKVRRIRKKLPPNPAELDLIPIIRVKQGAPSNTNAAREVGAETVIPTDQSDDKKIYIQIENLINKSGQSKSEIICLKGDAKVLDAVSLLHDMGYGRVCGFKTSDGSHIFPTFESCDSAIPVLITPGSSSYRMASGLQIGGHQRLVDFFNDFIEIHNHPRVDEGLFDIQLSDEYSHRSLRIASEHEPSIKSNIGFYATTAPKLKSSSRHMQDVEADRKIWMLQPVCRQNVCILPTPGGTQLGLSIESPAELLQYEQFAIRLYSDNANILKKKGRGQGEQDYLVAPLQEALSDIPMEGLEEDIVVEDGSQLEDLGEIQLQIAPKFNIDIKFSPYYASKENLDIFKTPSQLSQKIGSHLAMFIRTNDNETLLKKIYDSSLEHLKEKEDINFATHSFLNPSFSPKFAHEMELPYKEHISSPESPLIFHPVNAIPITTIAKDSHHNVRMKDRTYYFSPFLNFDQYLEVVRSKSRYFIAKPLIFYKTNKIYFNDKLAGQDKWANSASPRLIDLIPEGGTVTLVSTDEDNSAYIARGSVTTTRTTESDAARIISQLNAVRLSHMHSIPREEYKATMPAKWKYHIEQTTDPRIWNWDKSRVLKIKVVDFNAWDKKIKAEEAAAAAERYWKLRQEERDKQNWPVNGYTSYGGSGRWSFGEYNTKMPESSSYGRSWGDPYRDRP